MTNSLLLRSARQDQHLVGVVGVSHKTAPTEIRSLLGFGRDRAHEFLESARLEGIRECVMLSTCNRTEVYFSGPDSALVLSLLAVFSGVRVSDLNAYTYSMRGCRAVEHVFRVTAGLESAVLGETEIVAQVRDAWAIAGAAGLVGTTLNLVFQRSIEASKRVRTETDLCKGVISSAVLAVREAKRLVGFRGKTVLILGAGKFALRIAKELRSSRIARSIVVNRTPLHAADLANMLGAEVRTLDGLESAMVESDVVFAASGAEQALIGPDAMQRVMTGREGLPLTIMDLGLPANVASVNNLPGLTVVGLDEISNQSRLGSKIRQDAVAPALDILEQELERFSEALARREWLSCEHTTTRRVVTRADLHCRSAGQLTLCTTKGGA